MVKQKKTFDWWKWDKTKVKVAKNTSKKVELHFMWNIFSKKNSKRAFRNIVLPSENYVEWHKRMVEWLKEIKWEYSSLPCKISITTVAWERRRKDIDNVCTSILDLLVDVWLIPDDSNDIVTELYVRNAWFIRNLPITKVVIEPSEELHYDDEEDNKDYDWENKFYLLKTNKDYD